MDNLEKQNQDPSSTPQVSKLNGASGQKHRSLYIWVFLLLVIVVSATVTAFNIIKRSNNQNSISAQPEYVATVAGTLAMFQEKSKLVIPKIIDQSPAKFADLPTEIQTILGQASITAVTVEKLNFEEGKTGYGINYSLKLPLQDAYSKLLISTKSWEFLYSVRANLAAIHQAQNQLYQLQAVFKMAGDNNTDIDIQIIKQ